MSSDEHICHICIAEIMTSSNDGDRLYRCLQATEILQDWASEQGGEGSNLGKLRMREMQVIHSQHLRISELLFFHRTLGLAVHTRPPRLSVLLGPKMWALSQSGWPCERVEQLPQNPRSSLLCKTCRSHQELRRYWTFRGHIGLQSAEISHS